MEDRVLSRRYGIGEDRSIAVSDRYIRTYPLHTHDYCEIELVVDGEGWELFENERIPLKKGSVSVLTPADCHSVESEEGLTIKNISFCEELLPDRLKGRLYTLAAYTGVLDGCDFDRMCRAGELLALENEESPRVSCLLEYIFSLLPGNDGSCERDPVEASRLFADMHFREDISVSEGARVACLSPVYFGALFKKRVGVSYGAYVNKKRLSFALSLLLGGVKVTDACFEAGFGSVSNFSKAFKTEYGRAPGEYKSASYELFV